MIHRLRRALLPRGPAGAVLQATLDGCAWMAALVFAVWARLDFNWDRTFELATWRFAFWSMAFVVGLGLAIGLYRHRWRYGSFEEVAALVLVTVLTTSAVTVMVQWGPGQHPIPISAPLVGGFVALTFCAGTRYVVRLARERLRRPDAHADDVTRLLLFGAGDGAEQIITAMLRDPNSPYIPVAILDDDPSRRRLRIRGVRVVGTLEDLHRAIVKYEAQALLIAVPSASSELIRAITDQVAEAAPGLPIKVLPPVGELLDHRIGLSDIRDVSMADLLGRHQIDTDVASIAGYLRGRRVLVTGAGGSIGSELCRQIHAHSPAALIMVDRDESGLHGVQLSIEGRALLDDPNLVLADIRDVERIAKVFDAHRPEVVFHAAALKHLPLLEQHPGEGVKTNVQGTLNVLDASVAVGVRTFVNISTDKAADPISVLGYTKRIAERLTADVAQRAPTGTYLSVRFGNVLGSRGSVITSFQAQIEAGGPVTVTDRLVSRYFMTVQEAVQLVVQAAAIGEPAQVLVLDMGKPIRIADMARRLIERSGRPDIRIQFTGLRPGEKVAEVLFGPGEQDVRPRHPMISHVPVPPLPAAWVDEIPDGDDPDKITPALARLTSAPSPDASPDAGP